MALEIPKGKSVTVSRTLADYIVGLEETERPAYPSVGLSFKKFPGLENLVIDGKPIDGVARGRDFEKGDVVLAVDGRPFLDIEELRIHLAGISWGGEAAFKLLRSGVEKNVTLKFEELPPQAPEKK